MNKKALSLLEIIISVVILALVITGLANVFVAARGLIQHNRFRMAGGELGKRFLDPLQDYVREDTWSTGCFGTNSLPNSTIGSYTAAYTISTHPSNSNIKKVKTRVNWTE